MRDLYADLELCSKATKGPWAVNSHPAGWIDIINPLDTNKRIATVVEMEDAEFIAAAREGWPEAIERAIKAEERVLALESSMQMFKDMCENSTTHELDEKRYKEKLTALREENDRLQKIIESRIVIASREQEDLIQQLSAQVVELRGTLDLIRVHFKENVCNGLTIEPEPGTTIKTKRENIYQGKDGMVLSLDNDEDAFGTYHGGSL